jgi:hypothetical protein
MAEIIVSGMVDEEWLKITYRESDRTNWETGYALTEDVSTRYGFEFYEDPAKAMIGGTFLGYPIERIKTSLLRMGGTGEVDIRKDQVQGYGEVW